MPDNWISLTFDMILRFVRRYDFPEVLFVSADHTEIMHLGWWLVHWDRSRHNSRGPRVREKIRSLCLLHQLLEAIPFALLKELKNVYCWLTAGGVGSTRSLGVGAGEAFLDSFSVCCSKVYTCDPAKWCWNNSNVERWMAAWKYIYILGNQNFYGRSPEAILWKVCVFLDTGATEVESRG